ncbi:MAG: hypothetical protein H0W44_10135 [Gammaproteobacteria bacterium]|nr:hypothetical protein [Gammaproteobacteria bacterium]
MGKWLAKKLHNYREFGPPQNRINLLLCMMPYCLLLTWFLSFLFLSEDNSVWPLFYRGSLFCLVVYVLFYGAYLLDRHSYIKYINLESCTYVIYMLLAGQLGFSLFNMRGLVIQYNFSFYIKCIIFLLIIFSMVFTFLYCKKSVTKKFIVTSQYNMLDDDNLKNGILDIRTAYVRKYISSKEAQSYGIAGAALAAIAGLTGSASSIIILLMVGYCVGGAYELLCSWYWHHKFAREYEKSIGKKLVIAYLN